MKIYTKTGDEGETGLFGGGRVPKDDERVEAYGTVDELNSLLGVARAAGVKSLDDQLASIQEHLFTVGAVLATPHDAKAARVVAPVDDEWVVGLERTIDALEAELPPLHAFILPGGAPAGAVLHLARTVCRRAERRVVGLVRDGKVDASVVRYLNRLADLLFVMARAVNHRERSSEATWLPPKKS